MVIQKEDLVMGAPSSSILYEIFLQHTEHSHLPRLTEKPKLINYFRYIDDILVIYGFLHTNIQAILDDFNSMHQNLTFTDKNNKIMFSNF